MGGGGGDVSGGGGGGSGRRINFHKTTAATPQTHTQKKNKKEREGERACVSGRKQKKATKRGSGGEHATLPLTPPRRKVSHHGCGFSQLEFLQNYENRHTSWK